MGAFPHAASHYSAAAAGLADQLPSMNWIEHPSPMQDY